MCLFPSAHPECRAESFRDVRYGDCFPCSLRWKKPQRLREGSGRVPDAAVLRAVPADPQTLRPSDPQTLFLPHVPCPGLGRTRAVL